MNNGVLVEEISKEELQAKMNKYVEFEVSNLDLACELLEKAGLENGTDFIIISSKEMFDSTTVNSIKLFSNLDKRDEFNNLFVKYGINVGKINLTEETLESYFTELIK